MLQDYEDITVMMTRLIRSQHYLHYQWMDEGHEGAHPDCKSFSYDVLGKRDRFSPDGERCCSCVAKPGWWDENGTPRFAPHHPTLCPDIYASEVALVLIACQSCAREYSVQMSWSLGGELLRRAAFEATGSIPRERSHSIVGSGGLAERIKDGTLHYGDPPCFHDGCTTGATMNCWDLRVLEFWSRNKAERRYQEHLEERTKSGAQRPLGDWLRIPDHEIELPDARDPERGEKRT